MSNFTNRVTEALFKTLKKVATRYKRAPEQHNKRPQNQNFNYFSFFNY